MNSRLITLMIFINLSYQVSAFEYEVTHCMRIITHYCQMPQGYKAPGGLLFDKDWCPAWHENVMPIETPTFESEDDIRPALTTMVPPPTIDAHQVALHAKLQMQVDYIARALQQTIQFIEHHHPEGFIEFVETLLLDEPIINTIDYEPQHDKLHLTLQTNVFVVPLLQGSEWMYEFPQLEADRLPDSAPEPGDETAQVQFIEPFIIKPFFLDSLQCMGTITQYCKQPRKRKAPASKWSDPQWCEAWHTYVMPAF